MEPPQSPVRRSVRPLLIAVGLAAFFSGAQYLRGEMGLEWSTVSIRETVLDLGWWAPAGFVMLVVARQLLAMPSVLVLTSAGFLFGAGLGTVLGGVGLALNALLLFVVARLMGRDWVLPRLHARFPDFEQRANAAGPPLVAFMTAHPMGVLTPFHFASGVTGIRGVVFFAVVLPAALFRAACYSFLGANLLEPGSTRFWIASGLLLAVAILPLAHPGVRARLLRRPDDARG
ncbi:MAG: TVP38/TMEM64 family protein [Myxococcota bacterium]